MARLPSPLLLFLPLALSGMLLADEELRAWKNADGSRSLQAAFVKLEGDQITLKLKDGTTSTFALGKLSAEDRKFAEEKSRKPKADLGALIGQPGQAFDTLRFGMSRDAFDAALSASAHAQTVGGTEIEFFGQKVALGDFLLRLDARSYRPQPVFVEDRLTELRLDGSPVEAAPDSAIRSRAGELKSVVSLAFGDPGESFEFPKVADLPPNAFGVTDTWLLPGGRQLFLAISRDAKDKTLFCSLRITGGNP